MMTNQRGTVFFFILLGIALFAALSYAVVNVFRLNEDSGGAAVSKIETTRLANTDVQQFLEALRMRVYIMTEQEGVSESLLDFRNDVYKLADDTDNTGNNNSSCTVADCRIFAPYSPQGLKPLVFLNVANVPEQSSLTLSKNGHGQVRQIIIDGVGSPDPELVFLIHGVKPDSCNLFNTQVGITTTYTNATTLTSIGESSSTSLPANFAGIFNTTNNFGASATIFSGKKSFCAPALADGSTSRLAIWQVLKSR